MKALISIVVMVLISLAAFAPPVQAQTSNSPYNVTNLYDGWTIPVGGYSDSTAVAYFAGRTDTLPNTWRPTARTFLRVAGFTASSITVDVNDSANYTIVVKTRTRSAGYGAAGSWTTILSDSGSAVAGGIVKEFSLKDTDSDLFDGIDQEIFILITHTAHGNNDTQRTARRRVRVNYK